MTLIIRPETPADTSAITRVNDQAFGQPNEGKLIENLRRSENFIGALSLVAESEGKVVGHILFTKIKIVHESGQADSLALAPMSVLPAHQNQNIGSQLVKEGLKRATDLGYRSVIVLGHPAFYPRFGFQPASKWHIRCPFAVPDNVFMGLALVPGGLDGVQGMVEYGKAFQEM